MTLRALTAVGLALAALTPAGALAEDITLATSQLMAYVAVPIMMTRHLLEKEGINVKLVTFDSAQPITVAVVSSDADFGVGGLSAAFYNLAGQGKLRILAAGTEEKKGFNSFALIASNHAVEGGLKSPADLSGHSVGVTQFGTSLEYSIGLLAEKYRLDLKSMHIVALQSNSNVVSALAGGTLDAALIPGAIAEQQVEHGEMKRLAWLSDEVPRLQNNAAFVSTRIADEKPDLVKRFLRAYRKATAIYHDAVADRGEARRDGPDLPEIVGVLAEFAHLKPEVAKAALPWIDRDARLDVADMRHQIEWYRDQGMIKGDVDIDTLVDRRYAIALPTAK
ncbi:MAG TPA: ABC transporter substrate-binding protein [Stellaceae bacterium]|nr:ABC transporter substrate-binding protein [Stellaceae bacterium]